MSRRPNIIEALDLCAREGENLAKVHARDARRSSTYDEVVAHAEKRCEAILETARPSVTVKLYLREATTKFLSAYKSMRNFIANQMKLF